MKPPIKFLHTADLHLGAKFVGLGARGKEQRLRLREVLQDIVALAAQEQVDMVLLAGDVFDNNAPSRESLQVFQDALAKLAAARIPALLIGGTHDPCVEQGVLTQLAKQAVNPLVLLSPEHPVWNHPGKPVVVQGISLVAADQPRRPLSQLRRARGEEWQIGMAHASLEVGYGGGREASFTAADVAETQLDYLALGHWHRARDCSAAETVCWYSGSPEMIAMDEGERGSVLIVTLEEGKPAQVQSRTVGRRFLVKLSIDGQDEEKILRQAKALADPDAVLDLTLTGIFPPQNLPDLDTLRQQLESDFFFVRLHSTVRSEISPEQLSAYPENTVLGRFIRLVEERKQQADAKQQSELDQALQLGVAMITGREVTPWS